MACTRVQKTWWHLPSGEKTWQEVVAVLPVGLKKNGLMSKLANHVVDQRAKNEVIQLADQVNESQVRHLRLLQRCQQVKKQDLSVKKQAARR